MAPVRYQMQPDELTLLKELKEKLKKKFHKACLDAYLAAPGSEAIITVALEDLQRVIDEAR